MTDVEEIELRKRIARLVADRLAIAAPEEAPLFRLRCAHAAAEGIVQRAKTGGTIDELRYNLSRLEANDYEI